MSAAPLLRRQEAVVEEPIVTDTSIYQRRIPIAPDATYQSLFRETVAANTNRGLNTEIPLSDEDYLQFFVRALAKEVKALSASSGVPNFLTGRATELHQPKPNTLTSLLGVTPSAAPSYKSLSLNVRRPGKPQPPYIASALLVLEESVRALETGSPLASGPLKDSPATLFLYYRMQTGLFRSTVDTSSSKKRVHGSSSYPFTKVCLKRNGD